jgi:hypothetical protein
MIDAIFHLGGGFYKRMEIPELKPDYSIMIPAPSSIIPQGNLLIKFTTSGKGFIVGGEAPYLYEAKEWSVRPSIPQE